MSLLTEAAAELYGADPDTFITRRKELAAAARQAGDAAAAKEIAALAKPTRSAWLINRLVRADPSVPGRLAEMAGQLSEMPVLDAAAIRQLTVARRQLVDGLVRRATEQSDGSLPAPSAALRDEIADSFNAALADPQVAGQIEAGALVKAAHWAGFGFGFGSAPAAGMGAGAASGRGPATKPGSATAPKAAAKQPARRAPTGPDARERAARQALEEASATALGAVAVERDRREAVEIVEGQFADAKEKVAGGERAMVAAQQGLAEAQRALELAERQLGQASHRLAETRRQLSKARQDLKDAGTSARQAAAAEKRARQALDRLTGPAGES